jgi:hypothetical protein
LQLLTTKKALSFDDDNADMILCSYPRQGSLKPWPLSLAARPIFWKGRLEGKCSDRLQPMMRANSVEDVWSGVLWMEVRADVELEEGGLIIVFTE